MAQLENVKNPELIEHIQRIGKTFLRENTIKNHSKNNDTKTLGNC